MPSPIGHSLAGTIVGLSAAHLIRRVRPAAAVPASLVLACVALAVLPDIDLLFMPLHRTMTHSFTAAVTTMIIAAGVTRQVTGRIDWAVAFACGTAVASHLLCDWLGEDFNQPRGVQALWPWSDQWFISGWDVFRNTERRDPLSWATMRHNAITGAQELLLLGPLTALVWWVTRRAGRTGPIGRADQA
jgi:inner membrane protein